jgi:predicted nucleic acid-binding protein
VPVPKDILIKAVKFRHSNKKKDLSFFDCVGYMFAVENNYKFLTGDKEFKDLGNVIFIK